MNGGESKSIVIGLLLFVFMLLQSSCGGSGGGGGGTGTTGNGVGPFTVGGTVSGLSGTVVLQNNGGDDLTVAANGPFTFAAALADGSAYAVTVLTQPAGQTCTVSNGSGTIAGANVTNAAVACGSGSAGGTSFSGFDFVLKAGDFWEYKWDRDYNYASSFGGSSSQASGAFRVTLGNPTQAGGVTAYATILSGKSGGTDYSFAPRWKYLAVADQQILGSEDGASFVVLFDAKTGKWPGSGFFGTFSNQTLYTASSASLSNQYYNGAAIVVGQSQETSQCEYFSDYGTICGGDYNENLIQKEYYKENIGPVGYYKYAAISDMISQNWWSSSTKENVGLFASSLRGDAIDYEYEIEPNDSPGASQAAHPSLKMLGYVAYEDQGKTTVKLNETAEVEPNDIRAAPQSFSVPKLIQGAASDTDAYDINSWFTFLSQTIYAEDWYTFTLTSQSNVTILLNFQSSTTADLDVYLFDSANSFMGWSTGDNPATLTFTETIIENLAAGTYKVAIDAFDTPQGSTPYKLDVYTDKKNEAKINDWYSFTLTAPSTVNLSLTFDNTRSDLDLYVFNQNATALLASSRNGTGLPEGFGVTLDPGTYLVGVELTNQWNANYTLTIQ